jgi:hypothetical protein
MTVFSQNPHSTIRNIASIDAVVANRADRHGIDTVFFDHRNDGHIRLHEKVGP